MVLNADIRRRRLEELRARFKTLTALNRALGRSERDYTLGQLLNQSPDSKTGKPRQMGSVMARAIEAKLGLPKGWMDSPPAGSAEFQGTLASAVNMICAQADRNPDAQEAIVDLLKLAVTSRARRAGSISALTSLLADAAADARVEQAYGTPSLQAPKD
jgi:hypothetical protein